MARMTAFKVSKHEQLPSMKKLELHLLVQFSFLFLLVEVSSLTFLEGRGNSLTMEQ